MLTWVDTRMVTEVDPGPGYVNYTHIRPYVPAHQLQRIAPISYQNAMGLDDTGQESPVTQHASQVRESSARA